MIHRIEIATRRGLRDARGEHVASKLRSFLDIFWYWIALVIKANVVKLGVAFDLL